MRTAGLTGKQARPIRVLKFGGTSMGTSPARLADVAARVAAVHTEGGRTVVVVSARGARTDELIKEAYAVSCAPDPRELDQLLATGEAAAAALLSMALYDLGVPATSLLGGQAGIMADGAHLDGRIPHIDTSRLCDITRRGRVAVVAGFQGLNSAGDVTTLGRGGSDITASALAVALGARTCEIYTDVAGVYTADPRVVPTARPLARIGNGPMTELAYAGAQVLHARSVVLAGRYGVDIHVRSAFSREPGTVVATVREGTGNPGYLDPPVAAVAYDSDIARMEVRPASRRAGHYADVLAALATEAVAIDMVTPSGGRMDRGGSPRGCSFVVAAGEVNRVLRILAASGVSVETDTSVAKLSLVGAGLTAGTETVARSLGTLRAAGIEPCSVSVSPLRCSVTIAQAHVCRAARILHDEFQLDRRPEERAQEAGKSGIRMAPLVSKAAVVLPCLTG